MLEKSEAPSEIPLLFDSACWASFPCIPTEFNARHTMTAETSSQAGKLESSRKVSDAEAARPSRQKKRNKIPVRTFQTAIIGDSLGVNSSLPRLRNGICETATPRQQKGLAVS